MSWNRSTCRSHSEALWSPFKGCLCVCVCVCGRGAIHLLVTEVCVCIQLCSHVHREWCATSLAPKSIINVKPEPW